MCLVILTAPLQRSLMVPSGNLTTADILFLVLRHTERGERGERGGEGEGEGGGGGGGGGEKLLRHNRKKCTA